MLRTTYVNGFSWEDIPSAVRKVTEHAEGLDLDGPEKRTAAVVALRSLVSDRLGGILKRWRGPFAIGWWGYPVLTVLVYPFVRRLLLWAFDGLAPGFVDLLVDASKGKLNLNLSEDGA